MSNVNIEDAAHVIFFHPEYEEVIVEDLMESAFVLDQVEDKIQEYSMDLLSYEKEGKEYQCIKQSVDYLSNLLNVLKAKEVQYGKS